MSTRRKLALWAVRAALALTLLVSMYVLHLPAPSGVSAEAEAPVRNAWVLTADVARAAAALVPDFLSDLADPLLDDKVLHLGLFVVLALLWSASRALTRTLDGRFVWVMLAVLCALGGASELVQTFEGRIGELGDWAANVAGAAIGVFLVHVARTAHASYRRPPMNAGSAHATHPP